MGALLPILADVDLAALAKEKDRRLSRERTRLRATARHDAGLCRDCARPLGEGRLGAWMCAACQKRSNAQGRIRGKAVRDRLRSQGVCTRCGTQPVTHGRVHCADCLATNRRRDAVAYHAGGDAARARNRGSYANAAKRGVCPRCRGRYDKPEPGHKTCAVCRLDVRLAKQRMKEKQRVES